MTSPATSDDEVDQDADKQIIECLNLGTPRSFFLYAGAGSGKTRSLVTALNEFRTRYGAQLRLRGQRAGVITYTNAACDEIRRRLEFDPAVVVETIHSFAWHLIQGLNPDIRNWLRVTLQADIVELEDQQRRGRPNSKAFQDRVQDIAAKRRRIERLESIRTFKYDPNGENREYDSLGHSEVIKIASSFLAEKPLMQGLLVGKFPVLLVDESQDTLRPFMDALLAVQGVQGKRFGLGLLGDTMQRIYPDGKDNLEAAIPPSWARPTKKMNHRCPRRVVTLINKIRSQVDDQRQQARSDKPEGYVRIFLLPRSVGNRNEAENAVMSRMAEISQDRLWSGGDVKVLILEHHMAARRMGFIDLYSILAAESSFQKGLMDGTFSVLNLFGKSVLPLLEAHRRGDKFAITAHLRKYSPLLKSERFRQAPSSQLAHLQDVRAAASSLLTLWADNKTPRFIDVLLNVARSKLFDIPEILQPIVARSAEVQEIAEALGEIVDTDDAEARRLSTLDKFLLTSFEQIEPYMLYVSGRAKFDTHQGVKGLEFPRVMVIIDDEEARGFLFSYDKLFGTKDLSRTDIENERDGRDTGIARTRRLFYVTCSRAECSLALVAYSSEPEKVRETTLQSGWFSPDEIEMLSQ